jgi:hypothetical protein
MTRTKAGAFALVALCAALLGAVVFAPAASAAKYFHSPSGNIGCGVSRQGARCDINERDWSPPHKPRSCHLDWGYGLTLGKHGKGRFFCGSDSLLGAGTRLGYGKSVRRGRFKCLSKENGMKCVNLHSGHGFFIARQGYKRF